MRLPFVGGSNEHMQEILRGALVSFVTRVSGAGISFLFSVAIARVLGAEGTGLYFLAFTIATIGTVFGRLGLDNVLLRLSATHASEQQWTGLTGTYRNGMTLAFLASSTMAVIVFISAPWLSRAIFSEPDLAVPLRWMAVAIVPASLSFLYAELLKGLKLIFQSQFIRAVLIPGISLLLIVPLARGYGVVGAVWAFGAATVIAAAVGLILWHRAVPGGEGPVTGVTMRKLLGSSLPLLWVASLSQLMSWTAILLLGAWDTPESVGVFSVAARTALLTSFILLAVNSIAAPKFAELYQKRDFEALADTARRSAMLMTMLAAPPLLVFLVFPGWVMGFFGSEFSSGATVLVILAIGQFINVSAGSVGYLLMMSAHERAMRNSVIAASLISVGLNVALIPRFGLVGAAIATTVGVASQNIIASVLVHRLLDIRVFEWALPRRGS